MSDGTAKPDRQSQVTVERVKFEDLCGDIGDVVDSLEGKLDSVLTNSEPTVTDEAEEQQELVPLASNLRNSNVKLEQQLSKLRSIYNRLEN